MNAFIEVHGDDAIGVIKLSLPRPGHVPQAQMHLSVAVSCKRNTTCCPGYQTVRRHVRFTSCLTQLTHLSASSRPVSSETARSGPRSVLLPTKITTAGRYKQERHKSRAALKWYLLSADNRSSLHSCLQPRNGHTYRLVFMVYTQNAQIT